MFETDGRSRPIDTRICFTHGLNLKIGEKIPCISQGNDCVWKL